MKIAFLSDNYMPAGRCLDPFREVLLCTMARCADSFLYLQCSDYIDPEGNFRSKRCEKVFEDALLKDPPDLIFSINRAGLSNEISSQSSASTVSWFVDNPNRFPISHVRARQNEAVYCATRYQVDWWRRQFPELPEARYLPFCTDPTVFSPEPEVDEELKCDVSFVGTLWDPDQFLKLVRRLAGTREGKTFLEEGLAGYLQDYDSEFPQELNKHFRHLNFTDAKLTLDDFLSTRRRLGVLDALADLDLEVYGTLNWSAQSLLRSDRLFRAFRPEPIESPADLARLYRRTRVAISISHQQAQSGFPIRVFDIFASGVPLVSDPHEEMDELFEAGRCFLTAESPAEYSEQVRRLLRDPELYQSMRSAALQAVREEHSFSKRVQSLVGKCPDRPASLVEIVSENLDPGFLLEKLTLERSQLLQFPLRGGRSAYSPRPPILKVLKRSASGVRVILTLQWNLMKALARYANALFFGKGIADDGPGGGSRFKQFLNLLGRCVRIYMESINESVRWISAETRKLKKEARSEA